jgi:hypothetical protein
MSRSLWRCRNPQCAVPHGAVLGRVTADGGLALDPCIRVLGCFLDSQKALVTCPVCGVVREFRGSAVWMQISASVRDPPC